MKLQITLTPDLAARLRDYADLYEQTYGVREEPAELVPFMLEAFLGSDPEFRRTSRVKSGKESDFKTLPERPAEDDRREDLDRPARESGKPPLGRRSEVPSL